MAHHYDEETFVKQEGEVAYNCVIMPPHAPESPQKEVVDVAPPKKVDKATCCPVYAPPPAPSSDLVDALPVILMGIGAAYVIGVVTGAFMFVPSLES